MCTNNGQKNESVGESIYSNHKFVFGSNVVV
jgi:hypothetical protein